jgi:phosphopantetheine adenylyltransferase
MAVVFAFPVPFCVCSLSVDVVPIEDATGPAATDKSLDGLVVSSETLAGCRRINTARAEGNLPPLIAVVIRRTQQASLSSTAMRNAS